jgi:hypothetical protein
MMHQKHTRGIASCRTGAKRIKEKGVDVTDDPAIFPYSGRSQQLTLAQSRVTDEEISLGAV